MTIQAMLDSRGGVVILEVPPPSPIVRAPALKNLDESEVGKGSAVPHPQSFPSLSFGI
jgi:hypothetical protein